MNSIFVKVKGIVSNRSREKIQKILNYHSNEQFGEFLFFDYSFLDIPCGTVFSYFCERSGEIISHPFSCKILMVTQEFGFIYEGIPKGHRTLCHVALDRTSYDLIRSKVPVADLWDKLEQEVVLSTIACASIPQYAL